MTGQGALSDDAGGESRRRSPRITLQVPIAVAFEGLVVDGQTAVVNRHGALILCGVNCAEDDLLDVTNKTTHESVRCRVVWCGSEIVDGARKLGLEMTDDRPVFWGIDFASSSGAAFKG
jgi:hypothetical protein